MVEFLESDWQNLRKHLAEWRERYLAGKNKEIVAALSDETRTPTERFWDAKEKMDKEARILGDCLDGHSRSSMHRYLSLMYHYGLINDADLEGFSAGLQETVQWLAGDQSR